MDIHVANIHGTKTSITAIQRTIRRILKEEAKSTGSVNVVLCDDKKMLELNRRFRQVSKPTDVLSFPFNDSDLLGEIYISLDTSARQAKDYGATLAKEIQRLIIHGTCHLLGHTHKRQKDRALMEAVEARYL